MADARQVYTDRPTADEIDSVLGKRLTATVGTLNEDGSVHLAYVIFLYADGRLYFETSSTTRKARNAERRRWTSMIVQGQAETGRHLMVSFEGTARVVRDAEAHEINHRLRAKYIRPAALADIDRAWGGLDDIAVEITPGKQRSWTGSLLREETQKHLTMSYDDVWLAHDG